MEPLFLEALSVDKKKFRISIQFNHGYETIHSNTLNYDDCFAIFKTKNRTVQKAEIYYNSYLWT